MKKSPDPCARESNYEEHAINLHRAARKAYAEWWNSLTPEERAKAKEMHLENPPDDSCEVGGHSPYSIADIADSPLARCEADVESHDSPEDELADRFGISPQTASAILAWHDQETHHAIEREKANYLQIIVGGLLASKNPKLNSAALAFATKLDALNGLPCQREYARQNHISASAISKVVKMWQRSLNLRPSSHQKSEQACQVYSNVGKNHHWRARKIKASSAAALLSRIKSNQNLQQN